jgi:uncharacterized protein (DUF1778 family)
MTENTKQERIDIRLPAETKVQAERAALLEGMSLSGFLRRAIQREAREVIQASERVELSRRQWDIFAAAIDNPPRPNRKLRAAARRLDKVQR